MSSHSAVSTTGSLFTLVPKLTELYTLKIIEVIFLVKVCVGGHRSESVGDEPAGVILFWQSSEGFGRKSEISD